ncbi:transcriptional regulator FnrL [Paracoccus spongiarum]|uniref:Crp/Fnr family transcriptional regulator n=1 Tax=Paracoccus spongiarum TaxID=3064387 RepID=A0ABT9JCI0_9RHOB|nr:Crp/Fnr family transcriptional regulator [Paracoccus sp. 2205BS29-5]MDP5306842.1 Crp/Fnr family transcriptional regulator [Paracoccus sp. 2205BS29-5]
MSAQTLTQIKHDPGAVSSHGEGRCEDCPIRYRAVCAHCETDELALLEGIKFYRSYEPGQTIVWGGDRMDFVASVVTGVATLTQTLEDGRTQMVGLLLPSDFLGRPGRERATYNAVATTRVVLCCFRRKAFDDILREVPHLSHRLLEMTLDELDAAREWMLLLGRKSAREKIASFIAIIARREAALNGRSLDSRSEIDLPLTREAMADYLGLTLETVSRQVNALKRDGVIELVGKRGVVLPDFARLVEESGDDADGGWIA